MSRFIKILFLLIYVFALLFSVSCGNDKNEAGSPEEVLQSIKERGNSRAVYNFYTDATIRLLMRYKDISGMKDETSVDILSFIPENSEYRITGRQIENNICSLNFVFTKHPSENAIGQSVSVKMIKEGGSWKIDREGDLKKLIGSFEKKETEKYLNKIR